MSNNAIARRAFASIDLAIAAEQRGDLRNCYRCANAAGRQVRAAGLDLDAVEVLAPGLLGPGMGDAWAHLVDAYHLV